LPDVNTVPAIAREFVFTSTIFALSLSPGTSFPVHIYSSSALEPMRSQLPAPTTSPAPSCIDLSNPRSDSRATQRQCRISDTAIRLAQPTGALRALCPRDWLQPCRVPNTSYNPGLRRGVTMPWRQRNILPRDRIDFLQHRCWQRQPHGSPH
jgi:hypothetical protein